MRTIQALRPVVLNAARQLFCAALYWSGALWITRSLRLRNKAVVLTYHRVLPDPVQAASWSHPAIIVSPTTFEQHLVTLKRWFHVVSLSEFVERVESQTAFDNATCLITFDDGWWDTHSIAWPLLRRHEVPAVVFVPAELLGTGLGFWQEELGRLLHHIWSDARKNSAFSKEAQRELARFRIDGLLALPPEDIRAHVIQLVRDLKGWEVTRIEEFIAACRQLATDFAEPGDATDQFMTWENAREMHRSGVEFGGHGLTHRILTMLPGDEAAREIKQSQSALVRELGTRVCSFAYPNGDWAPSMVPDLERAEFRVAFTTAPGVVSCGDNRFGLRRVNMHDYVTKSKPLFLARVLGVI